MLTVIGKKPARVNLRMSDFMDLFERSFVRFWLEQASTK
jgi:hypothetical protein